MCCHLHQRHEEDAQKSIEVVYSVLQPHQVADGGMKASGVDLELLLYYVRLHLWLRHTHVSDSIGCVIVELVTVL